MLACEQTRGCDLSSRDWSHPSWLVPFCFVPATMVLQTRLERFVEDLPMPSKVE